MEFNSKIITTPSKPPRGEASCREKLSPSGEMERGLASPSGEMEGGLKW